VLSIALVVALTQVPDSATVRHADGRVPPTVTAVRVTRPPTVDGRLDDPMWQAAVPARGFTQQIPDDGHAPTDSTTVRLLYDDEAIYLGARMWDDHPDLIARRMSRRDQLLQSDVFWADFDSYHDHRTAFEFGVNAAGVKQDDITADDQMFGDNSWDPVWDVAVTIDSLGWTAEMRIPFSQLRFPQRREQLWGVNFFRLVFRRNEFSMYSYWKQTENGYASRFAHLVGLRDIPAPKRLEVLPYTVARTTSPGSSVSGNPLAARATAFGGAGADLKYGVTSNLTLDATVNPDFGQVEADPAFVNLSAFEFFLEERRPFFVEGASIFSFGGTGQYIGFGGTPRWFYSRRIGRPPTGLGAGGSFGTLPSATTVLAAAKLTGKSPGGWSLGVLDAVTARERGPFTDTLGTVCAGPPGSTCATDAEPTTNYFVGRVRRDVAGGRSGYGLLATATDRAIATAALHKLRSQAYVLGADVFHHWHNNAYTLNGSIGVSSVRGDTLALQVTQLASSRYFDRPDADHLRYDPTRTSLTGVSADVAVEKSGGNTNWALGASTTTPGFEVNDLGFQTRVDRISGGWFLGHRWTRPGKVFRFASIAGSGGPSWNYGGDLIQFSAGVNAFGQLRNFWGASLFAFHQNAVLDDRLTRGGPLTKEPESWNVGGNVFSDQRKRINAGLFANYSHAAGGSWSVSVSPNFSLRPSDAVVIRLGPSISNERTQAQFVDKQRDSVGTPTYGVRYLFAELRQRQVSLTMRTDVIFSPTLSLQVYAQPFAFAGDFSRFKELRAPRTFAFNVYGQDNGSTIVPDDTTLCAGYAAGGCYGVDPDGPGPAPPFALSNPDFHLRSLNSTTVLRWEYRPGSTLYVVWSQSRSAFASYDPSYGGAGELRRAAFRDRPTNVLLVKLNYWLSL
jgi:hypothetical protein